MTLEPLPKTWRPWKVGPILVGLTLLASFAEAAVSPPPRLGAEEAARLMTLPEGCSATVFAAEPLLENPVAMAWDYRGRLWVAENPVPAESQPTVNPQPTGRVVILADSDGRAESRTIFTEALPRLTSVEVGLGGVWVMCPPRLLFIPDRNGDDVPDGEPEARLNGFTLNESAKGHLANGLRWGPDGWLYGRCGEGCPGSLGAPGTAATQRVPIQGGLWRYHPGSGSVEVVVHGVGNPQGHDWDAHGELYLVDGTTGRIVQGITGAHFDLGNARDPNPGVFERMSNGPEARNTESGARCGLAICQPGQWPEDWRGRLLTINRDTHQLESWQLERDGTRTFGAVTTQAIQAADPEFRGIEILQGPEGSLYLLEGSTSLSESAQSQPARGRIYRISRGQPKRAGLGDLANLTPEGTLRLLRDTNVWYDRQLRIRLATLADQGADLSAIADTLRKALASEGDGIVRLRALWSLHVLDQTSRPLLRQHLKDPDEFVRAWAIRLLTDQLPIDTLLGPAETLMPPFLPDLDLQSLVALSFIEGSGPVRLATASALQRLPLAQRLGPANSLALRSSDATDAWLPAMVWFGLIPIAEANPMALANSTQGCRWPTTLRWISRSLAAHLDKDTAPLDALLAYAIQSDLTVKTALVQGMHDALKNRKDVPKPNVWDAFVATSFDADAELKALMNAVTAAFGR